MKILFVCLGNICRSPMAEGVFQALVREAGLEGQVTVESAGTGNYHIGELPDHRTRKVCQENGITLGSRARQFVPEDFHRYDYILAADPQNLADIEAQKPQTAIRASLGLIGDYDPESGMKAVPDPYHGNLEDFRRVYQQLSRCLHPLLEEVRARC